VLKVLDDVRTRESFAKLGAEVIKGTPEDFTRRLQADLAKWTRVRKETGIKVE
jgi:hypothetical protein